MADLFQTVFTMSVTGIFVILAVLLARLCLKRAPKLFSYLLWAVVFLRLVCPVSFTSAHFGLPDITPAQTETAPGPTFEAPLPAEPTPDLPARPPVSFVPDAPLQEPEQPPAFDPPQEKPAAPSLSFWLAASILWAVGVCVLLLYSAVSFFRLRRKLVGAVPCGANIYRADHIPSPFVLGLFAPKIYLPSDLTEREKPYILAHEKHHIRRLDHIIKPVAFLILCVHWFNPFVWLAFSLFVRDMEMSCDEAVIRRLGPEIRAEYCASLLSFATGRRSFSGSPLAFGEGNTKGRVKNMKHWKKPVAWITVLALLFCGVLTVFLLTDRVSLPKGSSNSPLEEPILRTVPRFGGTDTPTLGAVSSWHKLSDGSLLLLAHEPTASLGKFDLYGIRVRGDDLRLLQSKLLCPNVPWNDSPYTLSEEGFSLPKAGDDPGYACYDPDLKPLPEQAPVFLAQSNRDADRKIPYHFTKDGKSISYLKQENGRLLACLYDLSSKKEEAFPLPEKDEQGRTYAWEDVHAVGNRLLVTAGLQEGTEPVSGGLCAVLLTEQGAISQQISLPASDCRNSGKTILFFNPVRSPYDIPYQWTGSTLHADSHTADFVTVYTQGEQKLRRIALGCREESTMARLSSEGNLLVTAAPLQNGTSLISVYRVSDGKRLRVFSCDGSVKEIIPLEDEKRIHLFYENPAASGQQTYIWTVPLSYGEAPSEPASELPEIPVALTDSSAKEFLRRALQQFTLQHAEEGYAVSFALPAEMPKGEHTSVAISLSAFYETGKDSGRTEPILNLGDRVWHGGQVFHAALHPRTAETFHSVTFYVSIRRQLEDNTYAVLAEDAITVYQAGSVIGSEEMAKAVQKGRLLTLDMTFRQAKPARFSCLLPDGITLGQEVEKPNGRADLLCRSLIKDGKAVGYLSLTSYSLSDAEKREIHPSENTWPARIYGILQTNHAEYDRYTVRAHTSYCASATAICRKQELSDFSGQSAAAVPYRTYQTVLYYDLQTPAFLQLVFQSDALSEDALAALAEGVNSRA